MSENMLPGDRPESSLKIWSHILESLRQGGFESAGPEYLKLSRYVTDSRKLKLLQGNDDGSAAWQQLRDVGAEVVRLLDPLLEAARLLSELPDRIVVKEADTSAAPAEPAKRSRKSAVPRTVKKKENNAVAASHEPATFPVDSGE